MTMALRVLALDVSLSVMPIADDLRAPANRRAPVAVGGGTRLRIPHVMDPHETLDFEVPLISGDNGLVADGEEVDRFTLTLLPEAVALGVFIHDGTDRLGNGRPRPAPALTADKHIRYWVSVLPSSRLDPAFRAGVIMSSELTLSTLPAPGRDRQQIIEQEVRQP